MSVAQVAAALEGHGFGEARVALVLGSGLGAFADRLASPRVLPYGEIDGMPRSAVPGHAGRFVFGECGGVPVVAQQGRVHLYEGWTPREVTRAVRALVSVGVETVVLTNAAGGVRPEWEPGTLMQLSDHLNLTGAVAPLPDGSGPRAGSPYAQEVNAALRAGADGAGVELQSGVYAGNLGPNYETPAEVRMARWMGADAVGMSTVLEAEAACALGAKVGAISCITNQAAGISGEALSHDEVIETGKAAAARFERLLAASVPLLAST